MASLRKRNGIYYLVFTRREHGKLQQKAFSLGTKRRASAERLKVAYGERYALGEIDPFNGWTFKQELEKDRVAATQGTTLEEMGERFLESRSHVREVTKLEYQRLLDKLSEAIGRTMPIRLITEQDIRAICFKPNLSTASQTTYLRFCKMFFKWLHDAGHLETNCCERIKYPRQTRTTSNKIINEAELQQVFDVFKQEQRDLILSGRRGRVLKWWFKPMLATFFYAGLRAKEGINLTWDKVDLDHGFLRITNTKSGAERVIPIRKTLRSYLTAWHRCSGRPRSGLVFFKECFNGSAIPLKADHVSKTFKKYARAAKLPDRVNLHGLRHSCATELLRLGMGINEVASILGHSSLEITRIYEHLNARDLKRKMEQLGI